MPKYLNGVLLGCVIITILPACSPLSVQEVRERPPAQVAVVQGNYLALGECVLESMQTGPRNLWSGDVGDLHYDALNRSDLRRYSFTGKISMDGPSFPAVDAIFYYESEDKTRVEIRNAGRTSVAVSNLTKYVDKVAMYLERCSTMAKSK